MEALCGFGMKVLCVCGLRGLNRKIDHARVLPTLRRGRCVWVITAPRNNLHLQQQIFHLHGFSSQFEAFQAFDSL
jgi:hypothetical protein